MLSIVAQSTIIDQLTLVGSVDARQGRMRSSPAHQCCTSYDGRSGMVRSLKLAFEDHGRLLPRLDGQGGASAASRSANMARDRLRLLTICLPCRSATTRHHHPNLE